MNLCVMPGAAKVAKGGELGIAQLISTPNAVSFIARVATIHGNEVQVSYQLYQSSRETMTRAEPSQTP